VADGRAPGSRAAAAEASTGLWLAQLEAAEAAAAGGDSAGGGGVEGALALPRVAAPGLLEGLLGGWAAPDDVVPGGEEGGGEGGGEQERDGSSG
jgi:hypothetical protein